MGKNIGKISGTALVYITTDTTSDLQWFVDGFHDNYRISTNIDIDDASDADYIHFTVPEDGEDEPSFFSDSSYDTDWPFLCEHSRIDI